MVWAAECYFQDLEMICFAFFVFESKVGSLSTSINNTLIGLFFWTAKVAVHTNTPAPLLWSLCPLPCPTVPGYHATQPVARPAVETLCFLSLLSHSLESTGGISMWTTGPVSPSGISQQRRKRTRTLKAAMVPRYRLPAKGIPKHHLPLLVGSQVSCCSRDLPVKWLWQNIILTNTTLLPFCCFSKQDLRLTPLLPHHPHLCPVHHPSGPHLNLLFLTAHLHLPTTPRLRLCPQAHLLPLLLLLTVMERSWRWRWRWMMIMMGSLQLLELRKTAVGGPLYLQPLLA